MNRSVWSRAGMGAAVSVLMALGAGSAQAVETSDDSLSLKIASALRSDRLFMRAGVIGVSIKTKSGETYDVTGPVMTKAELETLFSNPATRNVIIIPTTAPGNTASISGVVTAVKGSNAVGAVIDTMTNLGLDSLGTPEGIKGVASKQTGTAGLSLGYFLGDEHTWVVEAYVLAAPLSTSVSATRAPTWQVDEFGSEYQVPFSMEGQKILTSKLLPPTVILGRYWGDKADKFRPYTGLVGMYAIFTDTKATDALNTYVGGSNPGDTTVSLKNAFGLGPMVGFKYQFADKWHASLNIGSVKLKTQATLTTRNTMITSSSGVLGDYGRLTASPDPDLPLDTIANAVRVGLNTYESPTGTGTPSLKAVIAANGGLVNLVSKGVAAARGESNLGTYVRKNETTLTNTIFMLSVGRNF